MFNIRNILSVQYSLAFGKIDMLDSLYKEMEKNPCCIKPIIQHFIEYRYNKSHLNVKPRLSTENCTQSLTAIFAENKVSGIDAKLLAHYFKNALISVSKKAIPDELKKLMLAQDKNGNKINNKVVVSEINAAILDKIEGNAEIKQFLFDNDIVADKQAVIDHYSLLTESIFSSMKENKLSMINTLVKNLLKHVYALHTDANDSHHTFRFNQFLEMFVIDQPGDVDLSRYNFSSASALLTILDKLTAENVFANIELDKRLITSEINKTIKEVLTSEEDEKFKTYVIEGIKNYSADNIIDKNFIFFDCSSSLSAANKQHVFNQGETCISDFDVAILFRHLSHVTSTSSAHQVKEKGFLPASILTCAAAIFGMSSSEFSDQVQSSALHQNFKKVFSLDNNLAYKDELNSLDALQLFLELKQIQYDVETVNLANKTGQEVDADIEAFVTHHVQSNGMFIVSCDNINLFGYKDPTGVYHFYDLQYDHPLLNQLFVKTPFPAKRSLTTGAIIGLESYNRYQGSNSVQKLTLMAIGKEPDQTTLSRLAKARELDANDTLITRQIIEAEVAVQQNKEDDERRLLLLAQADRVSPSLSVGSTLMTLINERIYQFFSNSSYNALFPANADSKNAELMGKFV